MTTVTLWDPYANDFTPGVASYVALQDADAIVAASLRSGDWPTTPPAITYDDADPPPSIPPDNVATVTLKMNALTDAALIIDSFQFHGRKADRHQDLEFPRVFGFRPVFMCWPRPYHQLPGSLGFPWSLDFDEDEIGLTADNIPVRVAKANAFLAAHLLKAQHVIDHARLVISERIGNSATTFRAQSPDPLPRHVRTLLQPLMIGGSTWSSLRA
jgi:hypothetical protein